MAEAIEFIGLMCAAEEELGLEGVDGPRAQAALLSDDLGTLKRIAKRRPHAVYRARNQRDDDWVDQSSFDGHTMIQVLDRAAHDLQDCLPGAARDLSSAAEQLRTPR